MVIFPNAKINIGLNVVAKREDGYHNLETCMVPIGWSDILEIIENYNLKFTSTGLPINGAIENNICYRAYQLLKKDFDLPPVHIHLHKVIPIGAGLGGGSADGTFTIKLLNQKFNLNLSTEKMRCYARQLGSDCAFFIENIPVFAFEKGDVFDELPISLKGYFLLLIYPNLHISTVEAYNGVLPVANNNLKYCIAQDIKTWKNNISNDFEKNIFIQNPLLHQIKEELYSMEAVFATMSGSGSTIFGIFEKEIDLSAIKQKKGFENYTFFAEQIKI